MIRYFFAGVFVCFLIISAGPDPRAEEFVGELRVKTGMKPEKCYDLRRDGKTLNLLVENMQVFNGDVIIPHEGKSVKLAYRHEGCGEVISKETVVSYDPGKCDSAGFMDFLSREKARIERKPLIKENVVSRGECPLPRIPVCPIEGSTALCGEPILFKWGNADDHLQYPKAKLVIREVGERTKEPVVSRPMTAGEFLPVDYKFQAGASYEWHVEAVGKTISDVRHFSILEKQASDNIRSQLGQVGERYTRQCPGLNQALYLQLISDMSPGVDLYSDSVRLMEQEKGCEGENLVLNGLVERFLAHTDKVSGVFPVELQVVLMKPVPDSGKAMPGASVKNGPCPGKTYNGVQTMSWKEMDKQSLDQCSVISFILKNKSESRSAYYCMLVGIDPTGKRDVIFPTSDDADKLSLIQYGETLDLSSEAALLLEDRGKSRIVLTVGKEPGNVSDPDETGDGMMLEFSVRVE